LTGDPRTLLARPDLADRRLEGLVRAARYAEARPMTCAVASAPIRQAAEPGAVQEDQLLYGETFDVLESAGDLAWGQARRDGYVGYVPLSALGEEAAPPTHWVRALRTIAFERPDFRSRPLLFLSMNSLLAVEGHDGRFVHAPGLGWVFGAHLSQLGAFETDPAAVAERFLHAPYQWGGRESLGLDCSGLVQQAFYACGRGCPRDTDQQEAVGSPIAREGLRRGDLVFWDGHVAMMVDAERVIHANSHDMAVTLEGLADAIARIERAGVGKPTVFRRP
jgi:NlpC/P60 family protein/dipeptidyl peptidase-like protein